LELAIFFAKARSLENLLASFIIWSAGSTTIVTSPNLFLRINAPRHTAGAVSLPVG